MARHERDYDSDSIPQETLDAADEDVRDTVPVKSEAVNEKSYNDLIAWMKEKKTRSFDEKVVLAYILECAEKCVTTMLCPIYSMNRTMAKFDKHLYIWLYQSSEVHEE